MSQEKVDSMADEASSLGRESTKGEQEFEELKREVIRLREEIKRSSFREAALEHRLVAKIHSEKCEHVDCQETSLRLDAVYLSTSWRVTRPIRAFKIRLNSKQSGRQLAQDSTLNHGYKK